MSSTLLTRRFGAVLELTLDRPEKHNAIDQHMLAGLIDGVARFSDDPALHVLLIRANGRIFSAGGDIGSALFPDLSHESPTQFRGWLRRGETSLGRLAEMIAATEKPTVVAHQGPCLGGALEVSLACDFRLASTAASYSLPETRFGAVPSGGGVARLTRLVGPHWARWLLVAGEKIDAAKAEAIGLVHAVHAPEALQAEAEAFCERLVTMPPEAARTAKLAIDLADQMGIAGGRGVEMLAASSLVLGREYREEIERVAGLHGQK